MSAARRLPRVRRLLTPGWVASHLFAVSMIVLMVNLGFWQLRRLEERNAFNEATAVVLAQVPADIREMLDSPVLPPDFTAATVTGAYLAEAEVLVGNRTSGGLPGFWMATPLRLEDGRTIAVVRGWISRRDLAGPDARDAAAPAGTVTVEGLVFRSKDGGRIAVTDPGERPEISRMDLDRFEEASGLRVERAWVRLRAQSPPQALPVPVPDPDLGQGPHLSYAFQWFTFSLGAVVVYSLILRRALRSASVAESPTA